MKADKNPRPTRRGDLTPGILGKLPFFITYSTINAGWIFVVKSPNHTNKRIAGPHDSH